MGALTAPTGCLSPKTLKKTQTPLFLMARYMEAKRVQITASQKAKRVGAFVSFMTYATKKEG